MGTRRGILIRKEFKVEVQMLRFCTRNFCTGCARSQAYRRKCDDIAHVDTLFLFAAALPLPSR